MSFFLSSADRTPFSARRRGFLLALLAALLPVAACSELTGGEGATEVIEVAFANASERIFFTARRGSSTGGIPVRVGEELALEVRLYGQNGVKVKRPHSLSVRISDPLLVSWEPRGDQSFALTGLARGSTSLRLDVSRGDSVVFTTSLIIVRVDD